MKIYQYIFVILTFLTVISPIFGASATELTGGLVNESSYIHYHEPHENTTGTYSHLIINNSVSLLGFNFDYFIIDYGRVHVDVQEVKNLGERLDFFFGIICNTNTTHVYLCPWTYDIFVASGTSTYDAYDFCYNPNGTGVSAGFWFANTDYNKNDFVIWYEVDGTITLSDHILLYISYYSFGADTPIRPPNIFIDIQNFAAGFFMEPLWWIVILLPAAAIYMILRK